MTETVTLADIERELVSRDLWEFLQFVRIPDPPPSGRGSAQFEYWQHIEALHGAIDGVVPGGMLPMIKARKLGITSYYEARFLWQAMYHEGAFLAVISQGEREAMKVISDCRFIYEHLPEHLQVPIATDNASTMTFKGGGNISAFPATSKAGRSYTGTEILMDECDFHVEFEASYNALLPLIQDSGGKMFLVSTANPDVIDSPFRQLYQQADNRVFFGYFERPNRTEHTYQSALDLSTDIARFEKENPKSEAEALAPPRTRAFFDVDVLQEMYEDTEDPRERLRGLISIWQYPNTVGRYIIGADTAWGRTGSYNVATVIDYQTGVQMAELHGRLHPDEMAREIMDLHEMYNHAYLGLERAGEGQERDGDAVVVVDKVVDLLSDCSCRGKLYYHDRASGSEQVPGWQTDGRTRPVMLAEFADAIRNRLIVLRCREGITEMLSFIRNEAGRPQASKGGYDDRVMAYAIDWQMRKFANFGTRRLRGMRTSVPTAF